MLRKKIGLSTNTGNDLKAVVYGISGAILIMEPGWDKTILLGLFMVTMMVLSWLTVGNIPPDMAEEIMSEKEISDVLMDGRDED